MKYDRHGYKPRERILLLTDKNLYVLDAKTYKQKHRLPLSMIDFFVTNERDGILLIRIPLELKKDKGDLILDIPNIIECCIWIMEVKGNKMDAIEIVDTGKWVGLVWLIKNWDIYDFLSRLSHNLKGKTGTIEVTRGNLDKTQIMKDKSGNLLVVSFLEFCPIFMEISNNFLSQIAAQ